jgi:hypothetical protein
MADRERDAELAARLAQLEARLAELELLARDAEARARAAEARAGAAEGRAGGRDDESIEAMVMGLLPADVRGHLRSARREQLLAARSMIDHWIARVDRTPPQRRRRESIPLEDA